MTNPRFQLALTLVNFALLLCLLLAQMPSVKAGADDAVIRGRALEIVDERGRVRASIKLQPAGTFAPTGKHYPETVMLRLIDANGRPEVKMGASEEGAGLSLVGESDTTQVLLQAQESVSLIKLTNKDGKQHSLTP